MSLFEADQIILTDEDGNEYEFELVDVIEVEGNRYAVLFQIFDEEEETDEEEGYVIMRVDTDENGEEILIDIEDDEEWEKVIAVWEEMLEEEIDDEDIAEIVDEGEEQ